MKSNRGQVKFQPFDSLKGFRESINDISLEISQKAKIESLFKMNEEEINELLNYSLKTKKILKFVFVRNNKIYTIEDFVRSIYQNEIVLGSKKRIKFEELYSLEL